MSDPSATSWKTEGVWVGEWFVEPDCNRLRTEDDTVQVEPKIMEILVCLIEHEGETVTKEKFLERVWGETVVTEDVLTRGISELRKVLGDDPSDPRYVETIRKTGYRLLASVSHADPPPAPQDNATASAQNSTAVLDSALDWEMLPSSFAEFRTTYRRTLRRLCERELGLLQRSPSRLWRVWGPFVLIPVLCIIGLVWTLRPSASSSPPTTVPFTSFPGEETNPALAPSGHKIAFAWTGSENAPSTDIYVKQNEVGSPLQLTRSSARDYGPAWSPNSQRIAFVRADNNHHSIHLTPLIGGSEQELLHFEGRRIHSIDWENSNTLIFSAQKTPHGVYCLYRLSLDTMNHERLTDPPDHYHGDLSPAIDRESEEIAFVRGVTTDIEDIYTLSSEGGSPTRLTSDRTNIAGLDWRAGEHTLVYATPAQTPRLWHVDASGGSPAPMPMIGLSDNLHHPSISETGRMALTQRSTSVNVWRLRRQKNYDRFQKQGLIESTRWDSNPSISPNGTRVAFASRRSGQSQIWVASRKGTDATRVTSLDASLVRTPQWNPSGTHIAFTARDGAQSDIYLTRSNGNSTYRLTNTSSEDRAPSWSQQGDTLYFASSRSGDWQIWAAPTDSTALHGDHLPTRQVTTEGGFAVQEAPDGNSLFIVKKHTPGIWRMPKNGGSPTRIIDTLAPYDWGNWAVTEYGIYFVRRDTDRPMLAYYSFESERLFRMAFLDDLPRTPSLAVAPGGEWFLYSRDQSQSDILLVDRALSE